MRIAHAFHWDTLASANAISMVTAGRGIVGGQMFSGNDTSLLLATHVEVRQGPNGPRIDDQTAAGIAQWCKHFERVTYYGIASDAPNSNASSAAWVDIADVAGKDRCKLIALPRAYRPAKMVRAYRGVRAELGAEILAHRYLCFTFGGVVGDWPSVAAREAIRQKRPYAAWLDRVEPDIIENKLANARFKKRLLWTLARPVVERNISHILAKSSVALLQGLDTFDHYAAICGDPHCTYDTHTHVSDQLSIADRDQKQAAILRGAPIKILYVGRAAPMKGPSDWLDVLERLHDLEVPFEATWIGDGPELPAMDKRISASRIAGAVRLHGFEDHRDILLGAMKKSDVFLFCHKTAESPRCLIEALVSGCPLIGYKTAYPQGLVDRRGGGVFVDRDDVGALADCVAHLHGDRPALAQLVAEAAASGELYNEDAVYEHRALLMKRPSAME